MIDGKEKKVLEWLNKRGSYLEHTGPDGRDCRDAYPGLGGYWPVNEDDCCPDPEMIGLGLVEFVERVMDREAGQPVDNSPAKPDLEVEKLKLAIYGFMIAHFHSLSVGQVAELAGIVKGVGK